MFILDSLQASLYHCWKTTTNNDDTDISSVVDFFWHQYLRKLTCVTHNDISICDIYREAMGTSLNMMESYFL